MFFLCFYCFIIRRSFRESPSNTNVTSLLSLCTECGHVDEWLCGLANPRHSQGHQRSDTQREEPRRWAVHERGTGQEVQEYHGWPQPPGAPLASQLTSLAQRSLWPRCCEGSSNTLHAGPVPHSVQLCDLLKQNRTPVEDWPVLEEHCCKDQCCYMTAAYLVYQKKVTTRERLAFVCYWIKHSDLFLSAICHFCG